MAINKAPFAIKGMTRDLAASKFSSEYAYENKNMRIVATDNNTGGALTNEKGNKKVASSIAGRPLGQATINDNLIVFSSGYKETANPTSWTDSLSTTTISVKRYNSEYDAIADVNGAALLYKYRINGDFYFVGYRKQWIGYIDNNNKRVVAGPIGDEEYPVVILTQEQPDVPDTIRILYINETITDGQEYFPSATDFSVGEGQDFIYKLHFDENDVLENDLLYSGKLNFDADHPIESISVYENSELQKIYWTDGKNQPRMMNIVGNFSNITDGEDYFNFVRKLSLSERVTINRNIVASGYFAPGVVQYCLTYFNLYGQESNIFYTSPLYYVSYNNRGASPEDTVSNSFTINIRNQDTNFDYVRIYCIHRTSLNGVPQARKVVDLAVPKTPNTPIVFTDNGNEGSSIDPTELLYVGGEPIVAGTMAQKDNTLFLGDIKTLKSSIPANIKASIQLQTAQDEVSFSAEVRYGIVAPEGLYPYDSTLQLNSSLVKTFKYLEYYRFGVQFQHYTGKWSEPIWICDKQNTIHPEIHSYTSPTGDTYDALYLPQASYFIGREPSEELIKLGYIKARPVVVFPKLNERAVVCQGVLAPTVYNVGDRSGNSPFAQSSWFFRPNSYLDVESPAVTTHWIDYEGAPADSIADSIASQVCNDKTDVSYSGESTLIDNFNRGKWVEFRHNATIPQNNEENAEIQCLYGNAETPYNDYVRRGASKSELLNRYLSRYKENFFVDQSIITLHSPDIEFDTQVRSLDTSNLKLRIVGYVPLTASASDISIKSSTPVSNFVDTAATSSTDIKYSDNAPLGEYKEPITTLNLSKFGWRSIISGGFWFDEIAGRKEGKDNKNEYSTGFVIYPWHRTGSYSNAKVKDSTETRPAKTGNKKLSVLRFSYNTEYLTTDKIWNAYSSEDTTRTGVSDIAIFDSNEVSLIRLKSPQNSGLDDISYYGNIDKVIPFTPIRDDSKKEKGYPIVCTGMTAGGKSTHEVLTGNYILPTETLMGTNTLSDITDQYLATDPVSMKYKTTPHAVLALNYTTNGYQRILPTNRFTVTTSGDTVEYEANVRSGSHSNYTFWDINHNCGGVSQDVLPIYPEYGYLWLGELYNDDPNLNATRFGGQTEEAFENNLWLPAGEAVELNLNNDGSTTITWTEGDTYYQRYDCLKTYPYTSEDENSVVDILSFMCETRVNIDGRYDRNRGQTNNLNTTPSNFNLLNPVYSQQNNFFNYRGVNSNKVSVGDFPNTVTWTKTKTLGEDVDTWTNVTLASTLDLDGTFGKIRAIRKFKDSLLAFQDKAISQILYNENVQIASTTGVPIEIANSGKVSGKRYISEKIGCLNKWSICTTPNGLYFHDNISKDLYLFSGEFTNLSDRFGFHSWVVNNLSSNKIWNPDKFYDVITFYDKENNDVLFITKDTCLAFSESIGQFTSFYDYGHTPVYETLRDVGIAIHADPNGIYWPYLQHEGPYNNFFGEAKPYWTTVVVNPSPTKDKVFNNVEFRADAFTKLNNKPEDILVSNFTFDTLRVWDEYQEGVQYLNNTKDTPSSLKKKFRIWHAQIPRWNVTKNERIANGRDRIRNPWIYLKLSVEDPQSLGMNFKTVLHDLVVDYFE